MRAKIIQAQPDWVPELVQMLEEQMVLAILDLSDDARTHFSLTPYSLGYIFGFCHGGLEFYCIHRELEKVKIMTQVYTQLFREVGHELFQITLNLDNGEDSQFQEGSDSGREEALRWWHRGENPIGLRRYVVRGEKTKSLSSGPPSPFWARAAYPLAV